MAPLIGAIILAAGRSGRMGRCKALLEIGGKTAVEQIQGNLAEAGIKTQVVITGHHAAEIELAIPSGFCVFNADYAAGGMISSVKSGVRSVRDQCDAMLVALVDHPLVAAETARRLIAAWILEPNKIVRPRYDSRMGHPVVIPATLADSILELPREATLKTWMAQRADQVKVVDVDDEGILIDLDTPADYEKAKRWREGLKGVKLQM
jgi:molybdenum cofactor cytidylyltransferase